MSDPQNNPQAVAATQKTVATPTLAHERFMREIQLVRSLMGGTHAMRQQGIRYLPREAAESTTSYEVRVSRTTLFNAYRKTVRDMVGKVFSRPIVIDSDVPAELKEYCDNIDLNGRKLNVFARDVFYDGMQTGITYILVDMPPPIERDDGKPPTVADEATLRPYMVHIIAENLIGYISDSINGVETLTQVRIRECVMEQNGPWDQTEITQIRVLYPGRWEVWREAQTQTGAGPLKEWTLYQEGTTSIDKITLVPVYVNKTGFMEGEPPLADLADLNLEHWQSKSDQDNILHVARVPILFMAGFNKDDSIAIGASQAVRTTDPNAKMAFVEHSGAAIGAGRDSLKDLELRMQVQGLQLMVPDPGQSATGEVRDEAKENTPLAMMALALEDALEIGLGFMGEYMGLGEGSGGSLKVNTDFGVGLPGNMDLQTLTTAASTGLISKETWWSEMQRRDILSDDFDPEVEADRLLNAAPDLNAKNPLNVDDDGSGESSDQTKKEPTDLDQSPTSSN